jgi:hypothetical protein
MAEVTASEDILANMKDQIVLITGMQFYSGLP